MENDLTVEDEAARYREIRAIRDRQMDDILYFYDFGEEVSDLFDSWEAEADLIDKLSK